MNTFFRIFGEIRVKESNTTSALYPPPPLRRFMATSAALQFMMLHWKPAEEHDVTRKALQRGALYPELAFQIMTGQEYGAGGLYDAFSARLGTEQRFDPLRARNFDPPRSLKMAVLGKNGNLGFTPTFGSSCSSSTRESGSSRHSSRKCGSGG